MLCPHAKGLFGRTSRKSSQQRKDRKQNGSEGEAECSMELMAVEANSAENSEAAELFQVGMRGPVLSLPIEISL